MLALHLCAAPAWPFSSSSKPAPTPTPTSATSALEASCKEHTERYHKYEWLGDCPEPRDFGARDDPAHFVAYEGCRATLPTRGCAVAIPPNYVEPPTSDDPAKLRLFDPHPAWKIGRGPQHWNRTATHFLGLANRLGWKPLLLISPSDHKRKSNSIEFVYQKPLKRP